MNLNLSEIESPAPLSSGIQVPLTRRIEESVVEANASDFQQTVVDDNTEISDSVAEANASEFEGSPEDEIEISENEEELSIRKDSASRVRSGRVNKQKPHNLTVSVGGKMYFACEGCDRTFTNKSAVSRHKCSKNQSEMTIIIRCNICDKTFLTAAGRTKHMKIKHPIVQESGQIQEANADSNVSKGINVSAVTHGASMCRGAHGGSKSPVDSQGGSNKSRGGSHRSKGGSNMCREAQGDSIVSENCQGEGNKSRASDGVSNKPRGREGGSNKPKGTQGGNNKSGDSEGGSNKSGDSGGGSNKSGDSKAGSNKSGDSERGSNKSRGTQLGNNRSGDSQGGSNKSRGGNNKSTGCEGSSDKSRGCESGSKSRGAQGGSISSGNSQVGSNMSNQTQGCSKVSRSKESAPLKLSTRQKSVRPKDMSLSASCSPGIAGRIEG